MEKAQGFVLAGGLSTRMGSDKALLVYEGKTLLERAINTLRRVTREVAVLGSQKRYGRFGVPVVEDEFEGAGPLAGIHAALGVSQAEFNLVIAVDTPHLTSEFLAFLLECARREQDALATVPNADGSIQPTCAVYRRSFRPFAEQALQQGKNKIGQVLTQVHVKYVQEDEIRTAGLEPRMFENLNTPEEFSAAATRKSE